MKPESKVRAPTRWSELDSSEPDAHLGKLFRAVADPEPLSAHGLARVHDQLSLDRQPSVARRRLRELSMAGVMLLAGSSFALAALGVADRWNARGAPASGSAAQLTSPVSAGASAPRKQASVSTPPPPEVVAAPVPDVAVAAAPRSSGSSRVTGDVSALAAETEALERILVKLRRERDPQGALALLDESQALFARGSLALEAQVARVDALLALDRKADALAMLERLPFAQVGRGGELRLVRAELRAAGDCGRALSDFDVLVRQPLTAPLAERALYGRAACELEVGDRQQAERDLGQYLARFPQGRFAAEVRSRLSRLKRP